MDRTIYMISFQRLNNFDPDVFENVKLEKNIVCYIKKFS